MVPVWPCGDENTRGSDDGLRSISRQPGYGQTPLSSTLDHELKVSNLTTAHGHDVIGRIENSDLDPGKSVVHTLEGSERPFSALLSRPCSVSLTFIPTRAWTSRPIKRSCCSNSSDSDTREGKGQLSIRRILRTNNPTQLSFFSLSLFTIFQRYQYQGS